MLYQLLSSSRRFILHNFTGMLTCAHDRFVDGVQKGFTISVYVVFVLPVVIDFTPFCTPSCRTPNTHTPHTPLPQTQTHTGPVDFASSALLSQSVKSVAVVDMGDFFFFFCGWRLLPCFYVFTAYG